VVVLRYPEHTLDATFYAADDPADCAVHNTSDRTCRMTSLLGPFFCNANTPLSLRC
jgi:hypothetical protein